MTHGVFNAVSIQQVLDGGDVFLGLQHASGRGGIKYDVLGHYYGNMAWCSCDNCLEKGNFHLRPLRQTQRAPKFENNRRITMSK